MTIYIDLILLINFFFDTLILLVVDITLKRRIKLPRIMLGGLFGSLTILLLFLPINSLTLFIIKIVVSILMIFITFGIKNIKYTTKNILYLYTISILLGGFLYFLNNSFSYKNIGLIFFHNGFSINYLILLILSPLILYIYIKEQKDLKTNYSNYYNLDITFLDDSKVSLKAILDTGNRLKSIYSGKSIILVNKAYIKEKHLNKPILIPYKVLNNDGLLKCIKVKEVCISNIGSTKNILLGISNTKFNIDGVDAILNYNLLEELNVKEY